MLTETTHRRVQAWLASQIDEADRREVRQLLDQGREQELEDRFAVEMEFGTGGLRGVMEAGTNRMNDYTVMRATQGLATYINAQKSGGARAVIAYDSRHNSPRFARASAAVLAANGIRVHLFRELRPTPLLSFAVRHLQATAGIVITSSHNPKEYNGYKVYWEDGAQIVPPHDKGIIAEVKKIESLEQVRRMPFEDALRDGQVQLLGPEIDDAYLEAIRPLALHPEEIQQTAGAFKIVYTPLHGSGGTMIPKALASWGFRDVLPVPSQAQPDGDFPTVPLPNPEDPDAFAEAIALAREHDADLVMASDPDCDRLGVAVRADGDYMLLTGNQLGSLLANYLCSEMKGLGRLPERPLIVTTIVTTDLIEFIGERQTVKVEETLTGFKWICARIRENEERRARGEAADNFIYGTEESYGYLVGTVARDKDAIIAACVTAEMAAHARARDWSLPAMRDALECKCGAFLESQESIFHEGLEGAAKIRTIMASLREDPPRVLDGEEIVRVGDVLLGQWKALAGEAAGRIVGRIDLPKSDVLILELAESGKVLARPSGTEPKIKFYFNLHDRQGLPFRSLADLESARRRLAAKMDRVRADFMRGVQARG